MRQRRHLFAQKHVHIVANEDGSSTNTGPITLKGGTGPFTELSGHGVDNGTATADGIGVGEIFGRAQARVAAIRVGLQPIEATLGLD